MAQTYRMIAKLAGAAALLTATAAQAEVITVGGTGIVGGTSRSPGVTTTLPNGATAVASFGPPTINAYQIAVTGFRATIGSHVFTFGGGQPTLATLTFSRGFMFFGGSATEAVVTQTFSFFGNADGSPPFAVGDRPAEAFVLASRFRRGFTDPDFTIAALSDPATAFNSQFSYSASGSLGTGRAGGAATAAFVSSIAPVPEPGTWAMMILGFGLIGGALRRRAHPTMATGACA
jgi:hypothetical protein